MFQKEKQNQQNKFLVLFFSLFIFFSGALSAQAASLYFYPANKTVEVGDIVKVSVIVNTAGVAINNAEANISFPTDMLDVASISKGSVFSLWVEEPTFSNGSGSISFNGGIPTPGYTGTSGTLISITFRAKKAGTATIFFSAGAARANDGIGTDVLTGMGQASLTLVDKTTKPPSDTTKPPSDTTKPPEKPDTEILSPTLTSKYTINSFDLNISIYNPAEVSQKYLYKEYLPKELKLENIIDNGGFTIEYDQEKQALLASAEFKLNPKETIKKTIRMQNVWYITERELNLIKNQASEYYDKLLPSQYFPQALILKNDLDQKIDKIISLQRENFNSAENLIAIYSENLLSLDKAKEDLSALKNLLDRDAPQASLFGFISGINTSVATNIIILLAINVILLIFILFHTWRQHKTLKNHIDWQTSAGKKISAKKSQIQKMNNSVKAESKLKKFLSKEIHLGIKAALKNLFEKIKRHFHALLVILVIALLAALLYWLSSIYTLVPKGQNLNQQNNETVKIDYNMVAVDNNDIKAVDNATSTIQASSTVDIVANESTAVQEKHYYAVVKKTPLGLLNLRSQPSRTASIISTAHDGDKLEISELTSNPNNDQFVWYQIILPDNKIAWAYGQYLDKLTE